MVSEATDIPKVRSGYRLSQYVHMCLLRIDLFCLFRTFMEVGIRQSISLEIEHTHFQGVVSAFEC